MDKLSTRIHKLVVFTPRIAPIGGTTSEIQPTLKTRRVNVHKLKKIVVSYASMNSPALHLLMTPSSKLTAEKAIAGA